MAKYSRSRPRPPERGILAEIPRSHVTEGEGSGKERDDSETTTSNSLNTFHVFTWPDDELDSAAYMTELADLDQFLRKRTRVRDQRAYRECASGTRDEVRLRLEQLKGDDSFYNETSLKTEIDDRIDIFNAAELLFGLFLPLEASGLTTGKFWGALERLFDVSFDFAL